MLVKVFLLIEKLPAFCAHEVFTWLTMLSFYMWNQTLLLFELRGALVTSQVWLANILVMLLTNVMVQIFFLFVVWSTPFTRISLLTFWLMIHFFVLVDAVNLKIMILKTFLLLKLLITAFTFKFSFLGVNIHLVVPQTNFCCQDFIADITCFRSFCSWMLYSVVILFGLFGMKRFTANSP
jgi:hypothetical protein